MTGFVWASGHLGWGIFALVVFTGLWLLLADLYWRATDVRITRLGVAMGAGWAIGVAVIFAVWWLAGS